MCATACACRLQVALLKAPWSKQLLDADDVPSVNPQWVEQTSLSDSCRRMLRGIPTQNSEVPRQGSCNRVMTTLMLTVVW